jgi:hypothetical protein
MSYDADQGQARRELQQSFKWTGTCRWGIEMKRFILFVVLLMLVSWILARHRGARRLVPPATNHWIPPGRAADIHGGRRFAVERRRQTQSVVAEARLTVAKARHEDRHASDETQEENRQAFDGLHRTLTAADDRAWSGSSLAPRRDSAEGLPVPIVPGTRVTEAVAQPPVTDIVPASVAEPTGLSASSRSQTSTVAGEISATEERAKAAARRRLRSEVVNWLDPDVPSSWSCPERLLDEMVLETHVEPHVKEYGTLYVAGLTVDSSANRRAALVGAYNRELVERRMVTLGGVLVFVLICLAAVSGYIRADEATKGYYTNRLRMLAAAGVGATGAIIYHIIV